MFGHDNQDQDNNQTNDAVVSPTPDPALDDIAASSDAPDLPVPNDNQTSAPTVEQNDTPAPSNDVGGLLDIKRQALQQLSPLVGHLDQSPEEKFKTTMMMIQAADDKSLVQTAYDAAQQITDEKTRAQPLLDVINEINYFTHTEDQDKDAA